MIALAAERSAPVVHRAPVADHHVVLILFVTAIVLVSIAYALGYGGRLPGDDDDLSDMEHWRW